MYSCRLRVKFVMTIPHCRHNVLLARISGLSMAAGALPVFLLAGTPRAQPVVPISGNGCARLHTFQIHVGLSVGLTY